MVQPTVLGGIMYASTRFEAYNLKKPPIQLNSVTVMN